MLHPLALSPEVRAAILAVMEDGTWCNYQGNAIERLVSGLQQKFAQPYVKLCSSGTVATEIALRGLQVGPHDEVILAAYDFPGNFRAVEATGARPVIVDLQPGRWTVSMEGLAEAISPRTKAIIVSHLHGQNTPMRLISDFAANRQLHVIEDTCQAPGAIIDGKPAGSWGDCSTLSFGGSKLLTSGRGGAILCRDPRIAQRIVAYCDRGNDAYPLSQLQAAALVPQLDLLDKYHQHRAQVVAKLNAMFGSKYAWLQIADDGDEFDRAFYKWPLWISSYVCDDKIDAFRKMLIDQMHSVELECGPGFHGFHRRSDARCRKVGELSNAKQAADRTILMQHHCLMMDDCMDRVAEAFDRCDKLWHENTSHQ